MQSKTLDPSFCLMSQCFNRNPEPGIILLSLKLPSANLRIKGRTSSIQGFE